MPLSSKFPASGVQEDPGVRDDAVEAYDYELPADRIASAPSPARDGSRLLVLERQSGAVHHARFHDLPGFLTPGDLLVLNDTRVLPARLQARRASGGAVEVLLLPDPVALEETRIQALLRPSSRVRAGETLTVAHALRLTVEDPPGGELRRVHLRAPLSAFLEHGELPLPPYLTRPRGEEALDRERYQTIYARHAGAVAAPTAGLHFTAGLLRQLQDLGIAHCTVTLHVGPGTFFPVRTARLSEHVLHEEVYSIPASTVAALTATRRSGGRILAVGTTTTRALEAASAGTGLPAPGAGRTRLLIRPPFQFRCIDALLTNFHLPRSTLLALVSALAGRERVLALYQEAVQRHYRFYSYGDAMLIL